MKTKPKTNNANIPVLLILGVLLPSFIASKAFTDPFIIPKYFWLYFLSTGFFLVFALWNLSRKYITTFAITRLDLAVLAFFGYTFLRAIFTPDLSLSDDNLLVLLICFGLYILFKPWFHANNENATTHALLIAGITLVCLVQAVYGILQFLNIVPRLQEEFKLGGAFGNPGPYSNFLVAVIPFSLVQLLYAKKYSLNFYLAIIALLASIIVLPLTKARTAWIALLASSSFIIFYRFEFGTYLKKVFRTTLVRILTALVVISLIAGSALFLYKFKEQSSSGRLFIWKVSVQMIPDKPLFGYGYDRFAVFHNAYQAGYFARGNYSEKEAELADNSTYAFNEFLQITIETGIIGLLLFLLILFRAFFEPNDKSENTNTRRPLLLAGKSALIAILITSLFSYPLRNVPNNVFLFLILSMISANQVIRKEYKFNQQFRRAASLIGIIFLSIFVINQTTIFHASKEWLNAFKLVRSNNYTQAKEDYEGLYPVLRYNPYFLFNYGAELSLMGEYNKSIKILKEAETGMNNADLYIYLGNSYTGINDLDKAANCFQKASDLMPIKFYPKYRLVKIFIQKGEIEKAKSLAREIIEMKVKIPSEVIKGIRKEMEELLESN
jgi:O-antigen ligase